MYNISFYILYNLDMKQNYIIAVVVWIVWIVVWFIWGQEYTKYRISKAFNEGMAELQNDFSNSFWESTTLNDNNRNIKWKINIPINIDWVSVTLLENQRFENVWAETSEWEKYDTAVSFKIKIENNSDSDYNYSDYDVNLLSKTLSNKITKIMFFEDRPEILKPQLDSWILIPWWIIEWYIVFYMSPEIKNSDLELRLGVNNKIISYTF